ncbi:MAG: hypothetical protein NC131_04140 [Roseburia sp.]|nr:hypothetical protein [Roseburia sp.]
MAKGFKIKKRKKVKTWLQKITMRVILPAYLGLLAVMFAAVIALLSFDLPDVVYMIASISFVVLLTAASAAVLVSIQFCRVKQALIDLKDYDFTPYTAGETETFSSNTKTEKYYFTPSPFDDDEGVVEFSSVKAADDYFCQFAPERLVLFEELREAGAFNPFYVFDFGENYFEGEAEKRREGEFVTVTVTEKPKITFSDDGVHIGGKIIAYEETEAVIFAGFVQPYACAHVTVTIILSDECAAVFAFGTRIMSVIDRHKIPFAEQGARAGSREIADYILSDPERAFRRLGRRGNLKNIKK